MSRSGTPARPQHGGGGGGGGSHGGGAPPGAAAAATPGGVQGAAGGWGGGGLGGAEAHRVNEKLTALARELGTIQKAKAASGCRACLGCALGVARVCPGLG